MTIITPALVDGNQRTAAAPRNYCETHVVLAEGDRAPKIGSIKGALMVGWRE
jgi:hypothetical protein